MVGGARKRCWGYNMLSCLRKSYFLVIQKQGCRPFIPFSSHQNQDPNTSPPFIPFASASNGMASDAVLTTSEQEIATLPTQYGESTLPTPYGESALPTQYGESGLPTQYMTDPGFDPGLFRSSTHDPQLCMPRYGFG